jgi:ABC-2 type transport system permease protein
MYGGSLLVAPTGFEPALLFPLTFVSNIFVDPATMPGWLRPIVEGNPISHLATAVRSLMAGEPDGSEIGWVFVASAALVAVFAPVTTYLYRSKK